MTAYNNAGKMNNVFSPFIYIIRRKGTHWDQQNIRMQLQCSQNILSTI